MNVVLRFLQIGLLVGLSAQVAMAQDMPWHLGSLDPALNAPAAINTARVKAGASEVVVAVIDSGVLPNHPSLQGRVLPGYDMISGANNLRGARSGNASPDERDARCGERIGPSAVRTHGTEVASLIAGNGVEGVRGVNPAAKILPVRLFGACQMSRADLLDSIAWAAGLPVNGVPANPHPARVINLSFAGGKSVCGADLQGLIHTLSKKNIFVVSAVGNTFGKKLVEPANCDGVVSVGAIDAENHVENYSGLDARTVIYAPGGGKRLRGDAPWTSNKLKVATYDVSFLGQEQPVADERGMGTSYAAPLVSGFISLLISNRPEFSPSMFFAELGHYTRSLPAIEKCPECSPRGLAMSDLANK